MTVRVADGRKKRPWPAVAITIATALLQLLLLPELLPTTSAFSYVSMQGAAPAASGTGRVAVVTGASRGIGRGIALELGAAGYTVYCLGRSSRGHAPAAGAARDDQRPVAAGADLTVESAADAVTARGGRGVAVPCDLRRDGVVEALLADRVREEEGRLDLLVCSAYTTPPGGIRGEFWKQELDMWDYVNGVGLRQVYAACRAAAPLMIETAARASGQDPPPLVCLVSSFGGKSYTFNVAYGVGKAAIDRLSNDMGYQLAKYGVATTALYPGLVRTEANLQMVEDGTWDAASGGLDLSAGETPALSGRAVVALAALGKDEMLARSGNVEVVAELAAERGFAEADGTRPPSIRSLKYLLPNFVFPAIEKDLGDGKTLPGWLKNNVPDVLLPWSTFSSGPPPDMDSR